jgi:hypothetical protein
LLGSDLSVGGVRVEPNPLLRLGDRLRLALYAAGAEPLVLAARVAHDEGRSGVGLVFVEPSEQERARLECMVSALPSLSALDEEGEKEQALVLGEIVSVEARPAGRPRASAGAAEPEHRQPQHDHDAADHHHEEAEAADHEPGQD